MGKKAAKKSRNISADAMKEFEAELERESKEWEEATLKAMQEDDKKPASRKRKAANKLTDELRAAVAGCGMTLDDLTRATGVDKSALSRFVNGERGLSMEAMDAIGQCLGLRIVADKPKTKKGK
jgi:antitoxin component HigA of HigAB toxin-antitoxin module